MTQATQERALRRVHPARWGHAVRVARLLWGVDATSVRRDALLRWMLLLPPGLAVAVRWVLPAALDEVEAALGVNVRPYYAPLMGFALLGICQSLAGMVVGFLLLDQRDDRTLTALQVTPVPLAGYFAYRLAAPVALGVALTLALLPLAGFGGGDVASLLASTLAAAPIGPLFALALAALAENKVQGFVLVKASGLVTAAPAVAYFLPPAWQWPFGLAPTFWPAKVYWLSQAGDPSHLLYLVVGLAYQGLLMALLLRRTTRDLYR